VAVRPYDDTFDELERVLVGALRLPTGRIVACDPYFCRGVEPIHRAVPPGRYAVELCLAALEDWGRRVALARIVFAAGVRAVRWEPAVTGAGSSTYFVDSGVGSFLDVVARDAFTLELAEHHDRHPDGNFYDDVLKAEYERAAGGREGPKVSGVWTLHRVPGIDADVAIFSSGLGDGAFGSHWGLAEDGLPTSLVTDFGVL
jgi:hypothetical protein